MLCATSVNDAYPAIFLSTMLVTICIILVQILFISHFLSSDTTVFVSWKIDIMLKIQSCGSWINELPILLKATRFRTSYLVRPIMPFLRKLVC